MDRHPEAGIDVEADFILWLERQADALRLRRFDQLDIVNLAAEIDSIVGSEKREVMSRLEVIIRHLLKCQYQPMRKSKSWRRTLTEQRHALERVCEDSPSLVPSLPALAEKEYQRSLRHVARETGIARSCFPPALPYSVQQLLDEDYLP